MFHSFFFKLQNFLVFKIYSKQFNLIFFFRSINPNFEKRKCHVKTSIYFLEHFFTIVGNLITSLIVPGVLKFSHVLEIWIIKIYFKSTHRILSAIQLLIRHHKIFQNFSHSHQHHPNEASEKRFLTSEWTRPQHGSVGNMDLE